MNARVYDPDIGRFLSPDPTVSHAHNPQSFNRYAYAYNNPLNATDPTGFSNAPNSGTNDALAGMGDSLKEGGKGAEGADSKGAGTSLSTTDATPGIARSSPSAPGTRPGDETLAQAQFLADPARAVRGAMAAGKAAHTAAAALAAGILAAQEKSRDAIAKGFEAVKNGLNSLTTNQSDVNAKNDTNPNADAAAKGNKSIAGSSTPSGEDEKLELESNPKHHQNSASPEPTNAQDLFDKSVKDEKGVRWAKDDEGNLHRFSKPSNNKTHWNGSTKGDNGIQPQNVPNEVKKGLGFQ